MEPSSKSYHLHGGQSGAALAIRVTPRARKNEISEILSDGTVKIRLVAPPVEGKANEALIEFLSDVLGVPRTRIEIVAGGTGRDKLVTVMDLDADSVHERIMKRVSS